MKKVLLLIPIGLLLYFFVLDSEESPIEVEKHLLIEQFELEKNALDAKIDQLRTDSKQLASDVKEQYELSIKKLQQEKANMEEEVERLKSASEKELKKAIKQSKKEYQKWLNEKKKALKK